jgi:Na+-translocating ferredoxin:NAD+ oxidoreductase RnfC subunit
MQSLGFASGLDGMMAGTLYCCECNLCTMFACPEDLDPRTVCVEAKPLARERGLVFKGPVDSVIPHPMAEFRRVPMRRLIARLGLSEFNNTGPLVEHVFTPKQVNILLKQHAGAPAVPCVRTGDSVREGDVLARPEPGRLGAPVHASMVGGVTVRQDSIVIDA